MSYDKAVDSAVLDAGLTAIANAIREKGGTSDPIAFDAMAQAIAAIEAGGVNYNSTIVSGSFTLSEITQVVQQAVPTSDAFKIEHNSGFVPRAVFLYTEKIANNCPTLYVSVVRKYSDNIYDLITSAVYKYYSTQKYANNHKTKSNNTNWNDSIVSIGLENALMYFAAGLTINWAVI